MSRAGYASHNPFGSVNLIETDGTIFNESLTANDPDFLASSDLLLVTLKAWQVSTAVKNLAHTLPAASPILLIHNGMGTIDELKGVQQPLLQGSTTQAARRDGNVIVHVANGTTHIGRRKTIRRITATWLIPCNASCRDVAWHNNIRPQRGASWRSTA